MPKIVIAGLSRCFYAAGLFLLFVMVSPIARAQTFQTLPEINTYVKLNPRFRLYFIASQTKENFQSTEGEMGPNLDILLRPLIRLRRSGSFQLDKAKHHLLLLRFGYRYLPSTNSPTENRGVLEATPRYSLMFDLLLSDRNRADLRFIDGKFSWRYRNRPTIEKTVSIHSYHFSPFVRAEAFYDSNYEKWSRTTVDVGSIFPIRKRTEFEMYYEHENDTSHSPNRQIDALGFSLNLYF
jgi:hypothetical protein